MKKDSRIIITIDKQFYTQGDEIKLHIWFNYDFYSNASLTILNPSGNPVDSAILKTDKNTTETFAITCGGPNMNESGYYTIRVECDYVVSEEMFEYFASIDPTYSKLNKARYR